MLLYMSYGKALQCWNQCGTLEISEDDSKNEEMCDWTASVK
jgi:hypothetical protein